MKMGPRLSAVASLVPPEVVAVDIGTERAFLPVFLVKERGLARVVAVDKSLHNVRVAEETVRRFGLEHVVEVRRGEGFSPLKEEDGVETVIIAGLGGKTICQMLMDLPSFIERCRRLVLQPMGDVPLVRRWLAEHGYYFPVERLTREKGRFYPVIAAEKGILAVEDPLQLEIGPGLLQGNDPLLIPWIETELQRYLDIIEGLSRSRKQADLRKVEYYRKIFHKLKGVLDNVSDGK